MTSDYPDVTVLTIIAEAGVNHNGDVGRAREMVAAAAKAGADYVKFQAFRTADLVSAGAATATYQAVNTGVADQAALLQPLELEPEDFDLLIADCKRHGIGFLCTAFGECWIDRFVSQGMDRIKVPSGELSNTPMLVSLARTGLPIFLSTGMATLEEVEKGIETLRSAGARDITLLQCTSLYPAPMASLNLRAMVHMADYFGLPVGFSDHSRGDHAAIAATALGATVIEKHFTLDRTLSGPDHAASLEPQELGAMVVKLHQVAEALGDGIKRPSQDEIETAQKVRRSWHAARDLDAGQVIGTEDIILKRPASGLPPDNAPIGLRLTRPLAADTPIRFEDTKPNA